jgi:hypothetical protein
MKELIAVLGSYNHESKPDEVSDMGRARARVAVDLTKRNPLSQVVATGRRPADEDLYRSHIPHAELVNRLLRHRLAGERILPWLETRHQPNEAYELNRLIVDGGYELLTVVTSISSYPRAPFVFAHICDIGKLRFVLAADHCPDDHLTVIRNRNARTLRQLVDQGGVCVEGERTWMYRHYSTTLSRG